MAAIGVLLLAVLSCLALTTTTSTATFTTADPCPCCQTGILTPCCPDNPIPELLHVTITNIVYTPDPGSGTCFAEQCTLDNPSRQTFDIQWFIHDTANRWCYTAGGPPGAPPPCLWDDFCFCGGVENFRPQFEFDCFDGPVWIIGGRCFGSTVGAPNVSLSCAPFSAVWDTTNRDDYWGCTYTYRVTITA